MARWKLALGICLAVWSGALAAHGEKVAITSEGVTMPAWVEPGGAARPRAIVIYLSGNPGGPFTDRFPLADTFASQGVATMWFNYPGTFGNGGAHTMTKALAQVRAAIGYIRSPEARERFGLGDPPIVLAGYSYGTSVALVEAARDADVSGVVAFAPCDHGYFANEFLNPRSRIRDFLDGAIEGIFGPNGAVPGGGPAFVKDLEAHRDSFTLPDKAAALKDKALLFIPAVSDSTCPAEDHFYPLYRALLDADAANVEAHFADGGHAFSPETRVWRDRLTADWLAKTFPLPK